MSWETEFVEKKWYPGEVVPKMFGDNFLGYSEDLS